MRGRHSYGKMHWLIAKLLAEQRKNRNLAFLARTGTGDMLAYKLFKGLGGWVICMARSPVTGLCIRRATFQYRRRVTITELSGSDLSDYQVRIDLDATNFDFSHFLNEGKDLRFTDANGNLLPYWVEKMDIAAQQATIWVKVPSIPANSTTYIYMYYGNEEIASASDIDQTFIFADDFTSPPESLNTTKWNLVQGDVDVRQCFAPNGATEWWFKPVAIYYNGKTYIIYIRSDGLLKVIEYNHHTEKWSGGVTLHDFGSTNDHQMGALWVLSDGRLLAIYTAHHGALYYRRTQNPEDITSWETENVLETDECSYGQLIQLNDGTIILFYRYNVDYEKWCWRTSTDGKMWSVRTTIIDLGGSRPYGYIATDGLAIHITFCYNDGSKMQNIYHAYSPDGGSTWKRLSDGATISLPLNTTNADLVYQTTTSGTRITDFVLDESGHPVILFDDDINTDSGALKRAKWNGSEWEFSTIGNLLRFRVNSSASYQSSGALDPKNPDRVIIAEKVNDVSEIREYKFNGAWNLVKEYTNNSAYANVRPRFVYNYANELQFINFQITKYNEYNDWSGYLRCYPTDSCPSVLVLTGTSGTRGLIESVKSFGYPIVLECSVSFQTNSHRYLHFCGMRKSLDFSEIAGDMFPERNENKLTCQVRKEGVTNKASYIPVEDLRDERKYAIKWIGDKSEFYQDDSLLTSLTGATLTDQVVFLYEGPYSREECYVHWIRVRKYTEPEPSVSIGAEESA